MDLIEGLLSIAKQLPRDENLDGMILSIAEHVVREQADCSYVLTQLGLVPFVSGVRPKEGTVLSLEVDGNHIRIHILATTGNGPYNCLGQVENVKDDEDGRDENQQTAVIIDIFGHDNKAVGDK